MPNFALLTLIQQLLSWLTSKVNFFSKKFMYRSFNYAPNFALFTLLQLLLCYYRYRETELELCFWLILHPHCILYLINYSIYTSPNRRWMSPSWGYVTGLSLHIVIGITYIPTIVFGLVTPKTKPQLLPFTRIIIIR